MTTPTIVLRVDTSYYSRRSDGSVWTTDVLADGAPDFTQATPLSTDMLGGSNQFVGARRSLDAAERIALANGIETITYFDS